MRAIFLLMLLGFAGCSATVNTGDAPRPQVLRDVEGYAVASCLSQKTEPYLKDQGDAWASVIVQRGKGNLGPLINVTKQVKRETAKGHSAVIRAEVGPGKDKTLPVLYCGEIIDVPAVRAAIGKAAIELAPAYTHKSVNE